MKLPWQKPPPPPPPTAVYISLGNDCTPATALRTLGLRKMAMPFDWVRSTPDIISRCILNDFSEFHSIVRYDETATRVVDGMGIEFTHDYPNLETYNNIPSVEGWEVHIPTVSDRYRRRIQRFVDLMRSNAPVVILCSMAYEGIEKVRNAMRDKYNRTSQIVFVSTHPDRFLSNHNTFWCASQDVLPGRLQFAAHILASTTS